MSKYNEIFTTSAISLAVGAVVFYICSSVSGYKIPRIYWVFLALSLILVTTSGLLTFSALKAKGLLQ
jgi:uncharacterized membrane protein